MLIVLVVLFAFKNNLKAGNVPESGKATVLLNSPFAEPKESTLNCHCGHIHVKSCLSYLPRIRNKKEDKTIKLKRTASSLGDWVTTSPLTYYRTLGELLLSSRKCSLISAP